MPKINLLDKSVYELIAAGEVIERPSSVIKELCENSIDAGARTITVEIKRGGISYIRVTDDGCGIAHEEVPTAFMRHATSKVFTTDDLDSINTLGFRGEALASVCAVGRVEVITKQADAKLGTCYRIEGGENIEYDRTGCSDGTTIIIRDLFFNTPARLKFLKKDVTEGNYCASVVEKLSLSHPDISFRFIRDGRQTLLTAGDGEYYSAVYAVFGKQFAAGLIPVDNIYRDTAVTGYVSTPLFTRANRTMQHFFVNGRSVRSPLCCAALEEAFRNTIMTGKFPSCVLCINTDPSKVDANIHPTKTEVRFTEEKTVFDAVYFAVKNALLSYNESREIVLPKVGEPKAAAAQQSEASSATDASEQKASAVIVPSEPVKAVKQEKAPEPMPTAPEQIKPTVSMPGASAQVVMPDGVKKAAFSVNRPEPFRQRVEEQKSEQLVISGVSDEPKPADKNKDDSAKLEGFSFISGKAFEKRVVPVAEKPAEPEFVPETIRVVGELHRTYIICETENGMLLIDKHAAHERVNFERLKRNFVSSGQYSFLEEEVILSPEEYNAVGDYSEQLASIGILLDLQENCRVIIKAMPDMIPATEAVPTLESIVQLLSSGNTNAQGELFDDILHTVACKASIRAHEINDIAELAALAKEVVSNRDIRYCPHGRPVVIQITNNQLERYFSRQV